MRIRFTLVAGLVVGLIGASAPLAHASTTSVYYDGAKNLAATNNPFPVLVPASGATENTAGGFDALVALTSGRFDSGFGNGALEEVTTGSWNTGIGNVAGAGLTTTEMWPTVWPGVATATRVRRA